MRNRINRILSMILPSKDKIIELKNESQMGICSDTYLSSEFGVIDSIVLFSWKRLNPADI